MKRIHLYFIHSIFLCGPLNKRMLTSMNNLRLCHTTKAIMLVLRTLFRPTSCKYESSVFCERLLLTQENINIRNFLIINNNHIVIVICYFIYFIFFVLVFVNKTLF